MTDNLNTSDIKIFENISNEIKEIESNRENDFNLFHKEIIGSLKKENITTDFNEQELLEKNKQLFILKNDQKISELYNSLFDDVEDKFLAAYKAILSNLPGVGPLFSVVFSIFSSGPNLKEMFEEILKKVEAIVKKAVEGEARRNCLIIFQNLQNAGASHRDLTTKWFDANGIKSHSFNGQEIKSNEPSTLGASPELEGMIRASYLDFKSKLEDALNHFSEPTFFGHTITLYVYTIAMYSSFLRDTITWGKQMNFPPEIIDGTANTQSLKEIHNNFIKTTPAKLNQGVVAYTKVYNDSREGYWYQLPGYPPKPPIWLVPDRHRWLAPPGFGTALLFSKCNLEEYPNGVTIVKPNSKNSYELEPRKGDFVISVVDCETDGFSKSPLPSVRFGTRSLVPYFFPIKSVTFLIENKNSFNRKVAININHTIGREGIWELKCYNKIPEESGSISKSFKFTSYDVEIDPVQEETSTGGMNRLGVFTINHKYISLVCVREKKDGVVKGYSLYSNIFSIDIIEQQS